jgi:hypothetical protein
MQKTNLLNIILKLINSSVEIRIADVMEATGLSRDRAADRRAIQRAFTQLIADNQIIAKGNARARSYVKAGDTKRKIGMKQVNTDPFHSIPLTARSKVI